MSGRGVHLFLAPASVFRAGRHCTDLCILGGLADHFRSRQLLAIGYRALGCATSSCLFDGSFLLHGAGTAVDLSRWLVAVSVLGVPDRWICAVVVGWRFGLRRTVALLLRRGSAATAAIAIIAVTIIAGRTAPRADMFTVIVFAAFLSLLWENYQTSKAQLWLLPLLMIAWVNCHLGFVAGLGLMAAFVGIDLLEMIFAGARRVEALSRLRHAWPWYAATVVATLVNPWGWGIYSALIRQNRAMALHSAWIAEWGRVPLNWPSATAILLFRNTRSSFYLLLAIAALAVVVA